MKIENILYYYGSIYLLVIVNVDERVILKILLRWMLDSVAGR
jgi:hypothetical protein